MPTIILVDVSLSMSRSVRLDEGTHVALIDLASESLIHFVEQLSQQSRLEYTTLVVFSSLYEVLVRFTRDFESVKEALTSLSTYDKTSLETALQRIESLVTEEWGTFVPVELILVTDGQSGIGEGSLRDSLQSIGKKRKVDQRFPIPFSFPCHLNIVSLTADGKTKSHFERLIELNYKNGDLFVPENLTRGGVTKCFSRLLNMRYSKYETVLRCGHFQSDISLVPPPNFQNSYTTIANLYRDSTDVVNVSKLKLDSVLNIIGFLDIQDFSHPPFLSRHLVVPIAGSSDSSTDSATKESGSGITSIFSNTNPKEIGFQPSFCVLLHGSLKMEKMGGVVKLGENWYGMLFSYSDNKKRSSLMLSLFEPGLSVPWLGEIWRFAPASELPPTTNPHKLNVSKKDVEESPFPVSASRERSYRPSNPGVWIKASGLQSDVQKALRYSKKLPDKQSAFFKEVNKLRRAGVMYSFHDLLNALASTLEKESETASQEVSVQLRHVAEGLRNSPDRALSKNIVPIAFRKKSSD